MANKNAQKRGGICREKEAGRLRCSWWGWWDSGRCWAGRRGRPSSCRSQCRGRSRAGSSGVDAGHGGYDGGCTGANGTAEKDLNLAVALLLRDELEARGATVVLSREEDIALIDPESTPGYKKRKELTRRWRSLPRRRPSAWSACT